MNALDSYAATARAYGELSHHEEAVLVHRWREHQDRAARERLIGAHLRYVLALASRYRGYGVAIGELVAEGSFGLVHALGKFDPDRGVRFVGYARYWIRAYMLHYVLHSWTMVGGGSGALRSKTFFKLRRARVRIANQVGDGAHADELVARALDISVSSLRSMEWSLAARDASLDSEVYANSPTTLGETLPAEGPTQEDRLASAELERLAHAAVFTALPSLDRRERYIVENRLLVVDEDELSLAEIARRLGVSRERARQLEARAKKKLKKQIVESAYGARLHEYSLSGDR